MVRPNQGNDLLGVLPRRYVARPRTPRGLTEEQAIETGSPHPSGSRRIRSAAMNVNLAIVFIVGLLLGWLLCNAGVG